MRRIYLLRFRSPRSRGCRHLHPTRTPTRSRSRPCSMPLPRRRRVRRLRRRALPQRSLSPLSLPRNRRSNRRRRRAPRPEIPALPIPGPVKPPAAKIREAHSQPAMARVETPVAAQRTVQPRQARAPATPRLRTPAPYVAANRPLLWRRQLRPRTQPRPPPQAPRRHGPSRMRRTMTAQTPRRQRPQRTRRPTPQPDRRLRQMLRRRRRRQPQPSQLPMRRTPRRQQPTQSLRRIRRLRMAPATIKAILTLRLRAEMLRQHPQRPPIQQSPSRPPSSRTPTSRPRRLHPLDRRRPRRLAHQYRGGQARRGRTARRPMPRSPVSRLRLLPRPVSQALNRTRMPRSRA